MKAKKILEPLPKKRDRVSDRLLSLEIQQAREHFEVGCNWARSLSEEIAGFNDDFCEIASTLEELQEHEFDKASAKKVRRALLELRKYTRLMAAVDEPLSVLGIIEDLQQVDEYLQMLKDLRALKGGSP